MPRHHYSNRAILILENPWELDSADCNRTSVLPFVEGIAKLAGDTEVFHANFYDKRSFDRALEILCSARFNNAVIYIAAHGCGFHDTWTPSPRSFGHSFHAHLDT